MSQTSQLPKPTSQPLTLKHYFRTLKDPRRRHRKLHPLLDIVGIALCAILCGANNWQQIATFGQARYPWLKRFLALPNDIPSHDTFERVFDRLDPQAFQACFRSPRVTHPWSTGRTKPMRKTMGGPRRGNTMWFPCRKVLPRNIPGGSS